MTEAACTPEATGTSEATGTPEAARTTEAGSDDDDPFYKYDDYGNPLDADSIARRAVLKQWKRMSPDEFFAHLVSLGLYHPDGTLAEPYRDNGEPSKYRPTD